MKHYLVIEAKHISSRTEEGFCLKSEFDEPIAAIEREFPGIKSIYFSGDVEDFKKEALPIFLEETNTQAIFVDYGIKSIENERRVRDGEYQEMFVHGVEYMYILDDFRDLMDGTAKSKQLELPLLFEEAA